MGTPYVWVGEEARRTTVQEKKKTRERRRKGGEVVKDSRDWEESVHSSPFLHRADGRIIVWGGCFGPQCRPMGVEGQPPLLRQGQSEGVCGST